MDSEPMEREFLGWEVMANSGCEGSLKKETDPRESPGPMELTQWRIMPMSPGKGINAPMATRQCRRCHAPA
jgi:hypothetical protein